MKQILQNVFKLLLWQKDGPSLKCIYKNSCITSTYLQISREKEKSLKSNHTQNHTILQSSSYVTIHPEIYVHLYTMYKSQWDQQN